jgi:hypothetical protein
VPDGVVRLIIGVVLLLHGIAHGGAMGALWWVSARPGTDTGGWTAARLWAAPALGTTATTAVAVGFWTVSMLAFVIAGLGFIGVVVPPEWC